MWPFKRKSPENETRAAGGGYTAQLVEARAAFISGREGLAEITASVQSAVSWWEGGLSIADVQGTDLLTPRILALTARALALRGEAVFLIEETGLVPAADWDLTTRYSRPTAYRLTLPEAGGGSTRTALAAEVLHFRIGADVTQPYFGTAPLRRAPLTASLLHAIEAALAEVYAEAPLGSQIVPMPESPDVANENLSRSFRGKRGRVLLRESVNVTAAGGPAPQADWRPSDLSPDLSRAMTKESLAAAREAVAMAFGVLPAMLAPTTTGQFVREGQRQLATWTLQPVAVQIAQEAGEKLGGEVSVDCLRPLQAFDSGLRARSAATIIGAMAEAKAAGLDPAQVNAALSLVNWGDDDGAA